MRIINVGCRGRLYRFSASSCIVNIGFSVLDGLIAIVALKLKVELALIVARTSDGMLFSDIVDFAQPVATDDNNIEDTSRLK